MAHALARTFTAVLVGVLSAVPASAFDIQSTTQNICECLCARPKCTYGASSSPFLPRAPAADSSQGAVSDGKQNQI
jgi:hypothetical protein